jgi:hypothetical protein
MMYRGACFPTISFRLLYGLLILHHGRREILWIGATAHPSAEWIARQLTEAFGWEVDPRHQHRQPALGRAKPDQSAERDHPAAASPDSRLLTS